VLAALAVAGSCFGLREFFVHNPTSHPSLALSSPLLFSSHTRKPPYFYLQYFAEVKHHLSIIRFHRYKVQTTIKPAKVRHNRLPSRP
jgi:hypothetical protein